MRIVMFYHSLVSDWNHGNAHFLRGIVTELLERGHDVTVYEPEGGWSRTRLAEEYGVEALSGFQSAYPTLTSRTYGPALPDLGAVTGGYRLLFHDTHHRSVSAPAEMEAYDLSRYDGVLAFGEVVRQRYLEAGWAEQVWTWHEAADVRVFHPLSRRDREGDLVWIGNWGDEERTAELEEFVITPVERLGLRARVNGVRYPHAALERLARACIVFGGWLPNYVVPEVFARFAVTVHVPRRPYVEALPGIPTIRMFEALACGIPLISAPWEDSEGLFRAGTDYLVARNGAEMQQRLAEVLSDETEARAMAARGVTTILERHTCAHRVTELLAIVASLQTPADATASARAP
jgi:spore maturation protein CgeB